MTDERLAQMAAELFERVHDYDMDDWLLQVTAALRSAVAEAELGQMNGYAQNASLPSIETMLSGDSPAAIYERGRSAGVRQERERTLSLLCPSCLEVWSAKP